MLSKSSTILLSLLLLCISFTPVEAAAPNTIPQFLDEYYEAVKDGDLKLSHNLLRYNEARLENYMKENHPGHFKDYRELKENVMDNNADLDSMLYGHLELVLWLDALVRQEPQFFPREKDELLNTLEQFHNRIGAESPVLLEDIKAIWKSVLPAAAITLEQGSYQQFNHHFELLSNTDKPEEIDRILSLSIEMMNEDKKEGGIHLDALIWTIIIVGGCIIFTLSYVGFRKYQAEQKERANKVNKRKPNS